MRIIPILSCLAAAGLLSACSAVVSADDKSGPAKGASASKAVAGDSRSFAAAGFTGVELEGSDDVVVTRGAAFAVVATGPKDVLDELDIRVEGGVLKVGRKRSMLNWSIDKGATIAVTMPRLEQAALSGSGTLKADTAEADTVDLSLSGSGDLEVGAIAAKTLDVTLAGSGDLTLRSGKADSGDVSLAGSGDLDMKGVTLSIADISLAGSGDIHATATTSAEVSAVGSGDVRLGGGAKCDSSTMGSGEVSCS